MKKIIAQYLFAEKLPPELLAAVVVDNAKDNAAQWMA